MLDDDGVYVLNVIDSGSMDFARAEAATLAGVFEPGENVGLRNAAG